MKYPLLIALIFLTACAFTGASTYTIPEDSGKPIEVYFCPRDNCEQKFLDLTKDTKTLDCAFFDLDWEKMIQRLEEKNARIVIEKENKNEKHENLDVKYDTNRDFMHNKFCIFDGNTIFTGSMNPTEEKNNNNIVIINSLSLANNYEEEFNELYENKKSEKVRYPVIQYNNKRIKNYFCPEDNCKNHVLEELNKAKKEITVMAFSFTDKDIADLLIRKNKEGVNIKGVVEKRRINMQYEMYKHLKENNVEIYADNNPAIMHHKVFVIDKNVVITGSMNPTKSGNEKNDENIIIIEDDQVALKFNEEFEKLITELA